MQRKGATIIIFYNINLIYTVYNNYEKLKIKKTYRKKILINLSKND